MTGKGTKALAALGVLAVLGGAVLVVYWRLLLTNRVLGAGDALTYFAPYRDYASSVLRTGRLPLWNPYLFLGAPFLANPQTAVLYPLHWPFLWLDAGKSLIASLALHLVIAGVGAYVYGRRAAGLSRSAALVTGLIFSLSGYLGAHAGQVNQISVAAWLPWLLWLGQKVWGEARAGAQPTGLGRRAWRRVNLLAVAGLALIVALQLLAGHTQASYINLVGLMLVAAWPGIAALAGWLWARLRRRPATLSRAGLVDGAARLALACAAAALGALMAAVQLVPTWELAQQSVRSGGLSYREVVSFSLRLRALLFTLLPSYGENLADRFGTPAFAEFVAYVGVAALVLAALAVLQARRQAASDPALAAQVGIGILLVVAGLGLALGAYNPLTYVLYAALPGFDLFRAPARWMVLYTFGVSLLAGIAVAQGVTWPKRFRLRLFRGRRWVAATLAAAIIGAFLTWQHWPRLLTVGLWAAVAVVTVWLASRPRPLRRIIPALLAALIVTELAAASLALDHTRPTAPEALTSLRTAPAHLLAEAARERADGQIPGRFLSMSGITYDPGDLADMQQIYGDALSAQELYDLVVASKLQEIVAPNLPLLWRLPAVDGYDGGVLPLQRYVDLQTLFIPADQLAPDGRLREQLQETPPSRLLRLLGVEHVITDKVFDVWQDDVYYDLQLSTRVAPGQTVSVDSADRLEATAIGVFSHLDTAVGVPDGAPVADVIVVDASGAEQRFALAAGEHTAEGAWQPSAAHGQPDQRQPWPQDRGGWDYLARLELAVPTSPTKITVHSRLPAGDFVLRGVSLIDERTQTHAALTVPADGDFVRAHSGDVKVYRHRAALPRAFVVGQVQAVTDDAEALQALADPAFDPGERAVLLADDLQQPDVAQVAATASGDAGAATVRVEEYAAERVALRVDLAAPGFLVLSDTWYPGWRVTVDGQPASLLRANLLFRAVALAPGVHQVVFEFRPTSLQQGAALSAVGFILWAALIAGGLAQRRSAVQLSAAPSV